MQIILLDETRFDNFALSHPNRNYYQTSFYGRLMSKRGYNSYYLGLVDDAGDIKGATLMIVKNEQKEKRKTGYAPRGFLIDWDNDELVNTFTTAIQEFLSKRNFTYLKVDPRIILKEHNLDGSEKLVSDSNMNLVSKLQKLGYIHMGYNNAYEASKPRWNTLINLDNNIINLYNSISREARNKISEAAKLGLRVYKGASSDISLFYSILEKQNPPLEFYLDYYQIFGQNNFEIYFTKLEPVRYVDSSKTAYEKEQEINNNLNIQIQDFNTTNKELLINEKILSDERLAKYKKNMLEASNLFQKYPGGIIIAATAVIKYGDAVTILDIGVNDSFKKEYPEYLLIWQLAEVYSKAGYKTLYLGGITSDFKKDDMSIFKTEISNKIMEYIGEFDLVINKKSYYTGSKLNPIINWLNTPI